VSTKFFIYRCDCAQRETVIARALLKEQFPQDDSKPSPPEIKRQEGHQAAPHSVARGAHRGYWGRGVGCESTYAAIVPDDPSEKRGCRLDMTPR
jgi:hypothetical protein